MFWPFSLKALGDHARDRGAVFGIVVDQRDVVGLGARGLHVLQEVVIDLGEVRCHRRDAKEPFEAALGEVGGDRLAVDERNPVFLGDRACRERDARLIGAGERHHLFFGDQPQRLVLSGGRAALVVGKHHVDLGAAEPRQSGVFRQREIAELGMRVVDDVHRDFDRRLGMNAGAGGVAAQRENRADLDGLVLRRRVARQSNRNRGGAQQPEDMLESHVETPPRGPIQYQASGLTRLRRRCPAFFGYFLRWQHCMPPLQGQVSPKATPAAFAVRMGTSA